MAGTHPNGVSQPLTDAYIKQTTVGEPDLYNAPITLADYDPAWPQHFAPEAERIRDVLGAGAIRIEHIGSTSVPGLVAKPLIDMLLVVANSADEPSYAPALEAAGYVLRIREPEWHQHQLFKGPDININMHVFSVGCEESERCLLFRDWLRTHSSDLDLYARTKQALAQQEWRYVQNYADAKSSVIAEIMARAQAV